jgi:predicted phosphohydrolase
MSTLRIAATADLHFGTRHTAGNEATLQLVARLIETPPDVLILAGDIGAGEDFQRCLALFDKLNCKKALVPGNHDIWVRTFDGRGDSKRVYDEHLPRISAEHGFTYLDRSPLDCPEADLTIVGNMNWYDYSWDIALLKEATADWEERLRTKRFTRGMHNDANFVRWEYDDVAFTDRCVATLTAHLQSALSLRSRAIVVAHHPPVRGLLFPGQEPPTLDGLLWRAFSGNERVERLLTTYSDRIPLFLCGHTHRARECRIGNALGHNIGGDYDFKRILWIDTATMNVEAEEFHGYTSGSPSI